MPVIMVYGFVESLLNRTSREFELLTKESFLCIVAGRGYVIDAGISALLKNQFIVVVRSGLIAQRLHFVEGGGNISFLATSAATVNGRIFQGGQIPFCYMKRTENGISRG